MNPNYSNLLLKLRGEPVLCGGCYEYVDETFEPNCSHKPEDNLDFIGMYECPDCGIWVLAGIPHPEVCKKCLKKNIL